MIDTQTQLQTIREIGEVLGRTGIGWWLFGGWGMDAHIGRLTRDHHDIEVWVAMDDATSSRDALVRHGFVALDTQPPEESHEFERDGIRFSTAFFVSNPDGSAHPEGRWSDWHFPSGSFGDGMGILEGMAVPAMSVEGMLAMKEQYATLRNGRPLREKDVPDIETLRALLAI